MSCGLIIVLLEFDGPLVRFVSFRYIVAVQYALEKTFLETNMELLVNRSNPHVEALISGRSTLAQRLFFDSKVDCRKLSGPVQDYGNCLLNAAAACTPGLSLSHSAELPETVKDFNAISEHGSQVNTEERLFLVQVCHMFDEAVLLDALASICLEAPRCDKKGRVEHKCLFCPFRSFAVGRVYVYRKHLNAYHTEANCYSAFYGRRKTQWLLCKALYDQDQTCSVIRRLRLEGKYLESSA